VEIQKVNSIDVQYILIAFLFNRYV